MQMPKWWRGALVGALLGSTACSQPDFDAEPADGLPEFQLEMLTGPSKMGTGWKDPMGVMLCNRGDVPGSTEVGFYLSSDSLIDESDEFLASSETTPVPAGTCRSASAKADDLGRRAQDLETLVCGTPVGSGLKGSGLTFESLLGYPAPSNLPRARVH